MMNFGKRAVGRAGVSISFPEHNSAPLRDILVVLGRIIKQLNADCSCNNDNSDYLGFSNYLPVSIFVLCFWPVSQ